MANVDDIVVKISTDIKGLQKGLAETNTSIKGFQRKSVSSVKKVNSAFIGLAKSAVLITAAFAVFKGIKGLIAVGVELEKSQFALAGLINSTTQFTDAQGNAVNGVENLNKSLTQANRLYQELLIQGRDLAGVTAEELTSAATFALPELGKLNITDAKEQAELIGSVTAALKQLNLVNNQIQQKVEVRAFLGGDIEKQGADFAKLVAQVNGGTDAFKANFEAAKQAGTSFEFLRTSLLAFQASSNLAAQSLDNQFSILQDSITIVSQKAGSQLLQPLKELSKITLGAFFEEVQEGDKTVQKFRTSLLDSAAIIGTDLGNALKGLAPLIQPVLKIMGELGALFAKVFGDLVSQNDDGIEALGKLLSFIGEGIRFVTNRVGSVVKTVKGAVKVILGSFEALGSAVIKSFTNLVNSIIQKINQLVKGAIAPINALISQINKVFDKEIGTLDLALPEFQTDLLQKGLNQGKKIAADGVQDIRDSFAGIIKGDVAVGLDTKAVQKAVSGEELFARSKVTREPGKDEEKGSKKAAKQAEKEEKARQREQEKLEALEKETALQKQIFAIEDQKLALITKERTLISDNQFELEKLRLEEESIRMKQQAKVITEQQAQALLNENNQKQVSLQNENSLAQIRIKQLDNAKQIATEEAKLNALLQQRKQLEQAGGVDVGSKLESLNQEILGQERSLEAERNKTLELDEQLQKRQEINGIINNNTEQQGQLNKACGKTNESMDFLKNAANQVGQNLSSSISQAIETGEFDLKSFASSVIGTFLQIAQQIATTFASSLGGGGGGAGGGFAGLFGAKTGGLISNGGLRKFSNGGSVSGAGTGTSDSVPAMLSNGEFVVNAEAVRKFGTQTFASLNRGNVPGFANGGMVNPSPVSRGSIPGNFGSSSLDGGKGGQVVNNFNITAMDAQDTVRALQKPQVQQHLNLQNTTAVQKGSNKVFRNGPFTPERSGR